jgi:hypothetical protein
MRKVIFSEDVIASIDRYIFQYKQYFRDLYSDTGIFSEETILEQYEKEAKARHREIFARIVDRLGEDTVYGRTPDNVLLISWRSKTLRIRWEDEGDIRKIEELLIF